MDPRVRMKKPMQQRTLDRMAKVFASTEALLLEHGPEGVSIPDVAEASGVPRASIYQFYPNKYLLFAAIADGYMADCIAVIREGGGVLAGRSWQEVTPVLVSAAANLFNERPVASILVLGWPMSRETYLSQETTLAEIGAALRVIFDNCRPSMTLPETVDVMHLVVELAFAVFKHSFFQYGRITPDMTQQATLIIEAYLARMVLPATS